MLDFANMTLIDYIANGVGLLAILVLALGYQFKKRVYTILSYALSTLLYILQYFLLGANAGVFTEIVAVVITLIATKQELPFFKKNKVLFVCILEAISVSVGLAIIFGELRTGEFLGLLPILANTMQTTAFFLKDEKSMRLLTLITCPMWIIYNFMVGAYVSSIGSTVTMISVIIAIVKYDILKKESTKKQKVDEE